MYEHNALGYRSGLACLTKVRSSRARCPATALIFLAHLIEVSGQSYSTQRKMLSHRHQLQQLKKLIFLFTCTLRLVSCCILTIFIVPHVASVTRIERLKINLKINL